MQVAVAFEPEPLDHNMPAIPCPFKGSFSERFMDRNEASLTGKHTAISQTIQNTVLVNRLDPGTCHTVWA